MQNLQIIGADNIKLIIAEKLSVARTIAKVLGVAERKDGYFQNTEYYVSWCIGHLVSAVYPPAYDDKYKVWNLADLPIIPSPWQYEVASDKKKQFAILKKLMDSKEVTELICATDSGREGELIFRLVYNQAGCTKPFKRLWTSSLEDKAILDGFENLQDGTNFDNLYRSADCRNKADWLIGMNLSRLLSLVYRGKLALGRVKTPTLAMIVERDSDIKLFKKETSYSARLEFDSFTVSSEKYPDHHRADEITELCMGKNARVKSIVAERKTVNPPKLYDLTTLQRECNRLFKYTAQQTLDIVQSLYEEKLITYPRTDSQYLTEDMEDTALNVVSSILSLKLYAEEVEIKEPNLKPHLDNSKVSDHYAIIPTVNIATADIWALPQNKQQVLSLIAGKLLCAVSALHVYESTKVTLECEGQEFTATGKTVIESGFKPLEKLVQKTTEKAVADNLPILSEGDELAVNVSSVQSHDTSPPKLFTEDTLLSAMERAGQSDYSDDTETKASKSSPEAYPAEWKKGIGTPATRASTIEGLVKDGYITRLKNQIEPTKNGINLVTVVPEEIRSAKLTADWEEKLQTIERGELAAESFMQEILTLTTATVSKYTALNGTVDTSLFESDKEVIGTCPRCGGSILYGAKHITDTQRVKRVDGGRLRRNFEAKAKNYRENYYCSNRECGFSLWENKKLFETLGKKLTKSIVADFLTKGESYVEGLKSKKGNHFSATLVLKDTGKYVNFDMKFDKK